MEFSPTLTIPLADWTAFVPFALAACAVMGPYAYLLICGLDLWDGLKAAWSRRPCAAKLAKAAAYAVLFLKLLLQ